MTVFAGPPMHKLIDDLDAFLLEVGHFPQLFNIFEKKIILSYKNKSLI